MENSERGFTEDAKLKYVKLVYYAVMLVAFVIGMYGLLSLFSLASAEIQQSVHIV